MWSKASVVARPSGAPRAGAVGRAGSVARGEVVGEIRRVVLREGEVVLRPSLGRGKPTKSTKNVKIQIKSDKIGP